MKPQTITLTHLPDILLVLLPEGHKFPRIETNQSIIPYGQDLCWDRNGGEKSYGMDETEWVGLPQGNWRIVSTLADLTEEQAQPLVFKAVTGRYRNYAHKDFKGKDIGIGILNALALNNKYTAIESLESAILAEGWFFENTHGDRPDYARYNYGNAYPHPSERKRFERDLSEWEQIQSRVLCRERCLVLRRVEV